MSRRLAAAALSVLLPVCALAQAAQAPVAPPVEPSAPAAPAAGAPTTPPAPPVAAPPAAPAPAPTSAAKPAVAVDLSGWLVLQGFHDFGGVNATDLPQWAVHGSDATGIAVRQSRVRASLGLPTDGLLAAAKLKGLVELDFMGPNSGGDASMPVARLRHVWVSASWPSLANLTVLAGQTWGVFTGPYFAQSLGHLAVPRFAGAGFLFRRAPQVRVSAEAGGELAVQATVAALAPIDKATSQGVLVGERSGVPDVEGRVAGLWRRNGKTVVELGASGRYGEQSWLLDGLATPRDERITSWGVSADARIQVPYLTVIGAGWMGEALGVYNSVVPGVKQTPNAADPKKLDAVSPVWSNGFWVQAIVTPVARLQLVGGYGVEEPRLSDLPATTGSPATATITRNQQVSGGAILALTSRWQVSTEVTWFVTDTYDRFERNATQLEVGSLYAF